MAKAKFDTEKAFKNIIGMDDTDREEAAPGKSTQEATAPAMETGKKPGYIQQMVYITPAQKKAIRMRIAMSEDAQEKDISAVVRKAIDMYLSGK